MLFLLETTKQEFVCLAKPSCVLAKFRREFLSPKFPGRFLFGCVCTVLLSASHFWREKPFTPKKGEKGRWIFVFSPFLFFAAESFLLSIFPLPHSKAKEERKKNLQGGVAKSRRRRRRRRRRQSRNRIYPFSEKTKKRFFFFSFRCGGSG